MTNQDWAGLDDDGRAWLSQTLGAPRPEPGRRRETGQRSVANDASSETLPPVVTLDGALPGSARPGSALPDGAGSTPDAATAPPPSGGPAIASGGQPVDPPTRPPLGRLLALTAALGGSDLHLSVGARPHIRLHGRLRPIREGGVVEAAELEPFLLGLLNDDQRRTLLEKGDLDAALETPTDQGLARFRASMFRQSNSLAAAFRFVPASTPKLDQLGLPTSVLRFADLDHGLVIVAGRTGSGKSTTLAAIVDHVNRTRASHIVTIEDPIEYRHQQGRSVIQQREVGVDTVGFATAIRHALRQDPDVILLGELRDLETIGTALTAAETGHLVLATLHSGDAPGAIHRIIDVFPAEQQAQVRSQLSLSLQGVVCQELVPVSDERQVPVTEVLVATGAVRHLIRDDKVHLLQNALETGANEGMHTMEQSREALRQSMNGVGAW